MSCRKVFKPLKSIDLKVERRAQWPAHLIFSCGLQIPKGGGKWRKGTLNRRCAQIMGVGRVNGLEKKSSKFLL